MNAARRRELDQIAKLLDEALEQLEDAKDRLEMARDEEQEYRDAMPESIGDGVKGEQADSTISELEDGINALDELIPEVTSKLEDIKANIETAQYP